MLVLASWAMTTADIAPPRLAAAPSGARAWLAACPWYLWCALLASTVVAFGAHWDIAWHRSIGRDTFWSPPHMAIYASAILAALAAGSQIIKATFLRARAGADGDAHVRVLGFRGP